LIITRLRWASLQKGKEFSRVHAVFAFYFMTIRRTSTSLRSTMQHGNKANNLLKEILSGAYYDIPGVSYYKFKLDDKGDIAHNFLGLPIIECWRGTSDTEASHRQLKVAYWSWTINIRTSHCQSSECTHRAWHGLQLMACLERTSNS
jgi:hypothetical protein